MQIIAPCSRQITTPALHHSILFAGQMLFLMPNQQCQSTEGKVGHIMYVVRCLENAASVISPVVDEKRTRPVGDFTWLAPVF